MNVPTGHPQKGLSLSTNSTCGHTVKDTKRTIAFTKEPD